MFCGIDSVTLDLVGSDVHHLLRTLVIWWKESEIFTVGFYSCGINGTKVAIDAGQYL
jgi:hypothetical protein